MANNETDNFSGNVNTLPPSPLVSNRDAPSLQDMQFAERMIYNEVSSIFTQNNVNDRASLYIKVTRSLWLGEASLQTTYDRQIAKAKQDKVWNAILHNPVIFSIQDSRARIAQEVSDLLQSHHIADEGELYKRVCESLLNGDGAQEILEQEISQDELDEIKPQLEAISTLGLPTRATSFSSFATTHTPPTPTRSSLLVPPSPSTGGRLSPNHSPQPSPQTPPRIASYREPQVATHTHTTPTVTFALPPQILPQTPAKPALGKSLVPRIVLPESFHPLFRARTPSPQHSPNQSNSTRLASCRSSPQINADSLRPQIHSAPPGQFHSAMLPPFANSASSPRGTFSQDWIPVFRLHSVLWKFHNSDFNKIEEWATQVQSTSQIAKQLASQFKDTTAFNKKLYSALFFHIKRQLDLGPFVESLVESLMELDGDVVVECEQYSLRMFINLLLSNCDKFLRQKAIHLISTSNPIPLTKFALEGDNFSHQFIPEPCSILEDKFLFFSFGIGKCKGKSTVLNKIFGTTFETSKDSQFFNGTVDCQGDRMFVPSRGVVVVDGHGEIPIPFKLGLFQLADGIIMHIQSETWNSDPVQVRHEIEMAVQYGVKLIVVLVRDAVESQKGRRVLDSFLSADLLTHLGKFRNLEGKKDRPLTFAFKLPSLQSDSMAEFYVRRIREKVMECLWTNYGLISPSGKDYPPGEIQFFVKTKKADLYTGLLSENHKASIEHTRNEIADLMAAITVAIKNNKVNDTSFFKVYPKFKAMRRLWGALVKAQFSSTEDTHKMRVQMSELSEEIKRIDLTDVGSAISKFEAMVTSPNALTMIFTFVQTLKKVVAEEVELINAEALILKSDIQANPSLLKSTAEVLQELSETMENKSLSIEVFWREINQLYLLGRENEKVCEAFVNLLKHGEPFEIIDGDNLYFPFQYLNHSLKNSFLKGKRILIIGVIGPQNSGKSTLLNFMFGCNFAASDGRTTKGVYGSLIESPVDGYDFLLILDTEGLHSIEKSDPEYDRKIVLFTLAVCDVVIANVRDQISDGMSKTIEICAKALTCLHNAKMPQPILFFVQNQRAYENIPHQAMADVIANLTQDGLCDTLKLGFDNFVAIPSAFNTKDVNVNADEKWQKLELLPKFVERVAAFTSTVLSKIKQRQDDFNSQRISKPFHDLPTWLEFAHNIFITVNKFDDLTRFGDILEEKQDQVVRKWLQNMVDNVLSANHKDNLICQSNAVAAIEAYFHEAAAKTEKELADFVAMNHIRSTVHKSHLQHMKLILETEHANWTVDAKIRFENERLKLDASNGQRRINEKIREIVRVNKKYTRSQLASLFDDCFKTSYDELVTYKQHIEESIKTLCLSIVSIYKLYCTDMPNSEEVKQQLSLYQDPDATLMQTLVQLRDTKYADMTYAIPSRPLDFIDNRILSSSEWVFVDHNVIALLKAGVVNYLVDHPTASELDDRVLIEIFENRPLSERVLITLSKWMNNAKSLLVSNNSHEQTATKWAVLLVRAFNSALPRNPELISKLVTVQLPFAMVKSKALEMQLQERLPSAEVIHRCVAFVNDDVIAPCDADLLAFGLALTQSMRARLHILMLQYVVAAHLNYHKKKLDETLANFQDQTLRSNWQANFIEQTLRGPNRDATAVEMLVEKFEQKNLQYCLEGARKVFADTLTRLDKTSTRFKLQLNFERNLYTKSQDELLAYVKNPYKFFVQQFEIEWKREEIAMLEEARMIYQREGNSILSLAKWAAEVQVQIASAKFTSANDIFLAPSGFDAVQVLQKKEKALVLLLCDLLQGKTRMKGYNIDGLQLNIAADWNVPPIPVVTTPPDKLNMLIELVTFVDSISDLHLFASRLSARLLATGNLLRRHQCFTHQLDPENILQNAREKAAGCNQLCPCCMRCCDEEHWRFITPVGVGNNRHKCRLGHQYRGMAGFSYEKTKFASLKICGNMQETELIWFQDRFVLWNEFKSKFPTWDFHFPVYLENETIEESASRIARIWHDVGQELCTEFDIQFTTKDQSYTERAKHFVFAVGTSSSMKTNWQTFLRAAKNFVDIKLQLDPEVTHTLTCITFTNRASIPFHNVLLTESSFNQDTLSFPLTCGDPSFSIASSAVLEVVEKHSARDPVVLIFVSDGDDSFPHKELRSLCQDKHWKKIDSFWTVAIGNKLSNGTLFGMAQWLAKEDQKKGHFRNPKSYTDLVEVFEEMAIKT